MAQKKHIQSPEPAPTPSTAGFTLIELILAMVLVGVMVLTAGMGIVSAMRGYAFTRDNVEVAQRAQLVIARLQREFSGISHVDDSLSDATCIRYKRDVDSDDYRVVKYDSANERIMMAILTDDPTTALPIDESADQDCSDTGHLLGEKITGFAVAYLDDQGAVLTPSLFDEANIWGIRATVSFALYDAGRNANFTLVTAIRNKGGEDAPAF